MRLWRGTAATLLVSIVILPIAAVARLWGIGFCLPHPRCRPDEDAISAIASGLRLDDLNPDVFNYPALFMLVVAAALWALPYGEQFLHKAMPFHFRPLLRDVSTTSTNYMVARFLSAAAGIATVWVMFRTALRLFDRAAAVAASALLALAFLHVRDSHYGVTDVPMTFMVAVAFLCAVRLSQSGTRSDLVLAGLMSGLATSTKYNAALVALPGLFAVLAGVPGTKSVRARLTQAAVFVLLMAAAFICASPYTVLDYERFFADFSSDVQHLSGGHGVALGRGWAYHATTTLYHGVGAPILCAGVAGLLLLIARDPRKGILVALFPVSYYAILGSGYTVFSRHMVPVVPFLCLTAGFFITECASWAAARLRRPSWSAALAAAAVAAALWPSVTSVVRFNALLARTDNRMLARRWVEQRFEPGTTIAQIGPEGGHVFLHDANEVFYKTVEFSREAPRPHLVIVQTSPLMADTALGEMERILRAEYATAFKSDISVADPRNVYDRQDEFYLPLAGFHAIDRPGPNLEIFVRR